MNEVEGVPVCLSVAECTCSRQNETRYLHDAVDKGTQTVDTCAGNTKAMRFR